MGAIELDPRIVGLSTQKITKSFVRNSLTKAEMNEPYYKTEYTSKTKQWPISTGDPLDVLEGISCFIKQLPQDSRPTLYSYGRNSIFVEYLVPYEHRIDPVDFYQDKWKNDIKEHKAQVDEYKRYMELKAKYGD